MRPHTVISIMFTAVGAPGTFTLIKRLRSELQPCYIIGVDMNRDVAARFLVDDFYQVPPANSDRYISAMLSIARERMVDLIFPTSSYEVLPLAENVELFRNFGCRIMVSDIDAIKKAIDKGYLYESFRDISPKYAMITEFDDKELINGLESLGYPDKKICIKPAISKGSRGFRIIAGTGKQKPFYETKPQDNVCITYDALIKEIQTGCPPLLLMEFLDDLDHYDCMVLADNGDSLITTVKTREQHRWGVITKGELIEDPQKVQMCERIIKELGLSYNISIQFIGNKLLEVNPRTSTYIWGKDFNEPLLAIHLAMGWTKKEEIRTYQDRAPIGRKMIRYMDQVFYGGKQSR